MKKKFKETINVTVHIVEGYLETKVRLHAFASSSSMVAHSFMCTVNGKSIVVPFTKNAWNTSHAFDIKITDLVSIKSANGGECDLTFSLEEGMRVTHRIENFDINDRQFIRKLKG